MKSIILVNKPVGLTPLETIYHFKKKHSEYAEEVIGYAGRLDPMAEGLLLLLIGDENKKRKEYEDMDKTYEFSMLLGVSTDTYDLMGLIVDVAKSGELRAKSSTYTKQISELLPSFLVRRLFPIPPTLPVQLMEFLYTSTLGRTGYMK